MGNKEDNINISKKKTFFKITPKLNSYLTKYGRHIKLPITYDDLMHYTDAFILKGKNGKDTLWETVLYDQNNMQEIFKGLKYIYCIMKTTGDLNLMRNIEVDRVDYCTFGNSNPFRIKVTNKVNDNYEYFYVKKADASRIYGLELEEILSPNRITFLTDGNNTLIEEHIPGIPGDVYIKEYMENPNISHTINFVKLTKEFVKFNERCFIRLLGDMRSYNFVVVVTHDFEYDQYRIRSIDFDQQSYEGKKKLYMPQFFIENTAFVKKGLTLIDPITTKQYQYEERSLIFSRISSTRYRIKELIDSMRQTKLSEDDKIIQLRNELAEHHKEKRFLKCNTMGDLVRLNFHSLIKNVKPS